MKLMKRHEKKEIFKLFDFLGEIFLGKIFLLKNKKIHRKKNLKKILKNSEGPSFLPFFNSNLERIHFLFQIFFS